MSLIKIRRRVASRLPPRRVGDGRHARRIDTFALQRSGQHLVIDWICRGYGEILHFNHCRFYRNGWRLELRPATGRRVVYAGAAKDDSGRQGRWNLEASLPPRPFPRLLYSMEDVRLDDPLVHAVRRTRPADAVLVLRDPANWLASSLVHGRASPEELVEKRDRLVQYLEHALGVKDHLGGPAVAVDFPRFTVDASYRAALAVTLDLTALEAAEAALDAVPSFGGGSSFGPRGAGHPPGQRVLERWRACRDDPFFRSVLDHPSLWELADAFFGEAPRPFG